MFAAKDGLVWPADVGMLLVGHGSRDETGNREFLQTARRVAEGAVRAAVEPSFLEFAQPNIAKGLERLARREARTIVVVPVILFAAGHAKRDIPVAVAQAAARHPGITVAHSEHLGCHGAILELSGRRFDEATRNRAGAKDRTVLVMVGRGSHDADATAEMQRFVGSCRQASQARRAIACFVAMAEPSLSEALDEAVSDGAARVVVQPHFLFGGVLVDRIRQAVDEYRARHPRVDWITTGHLGPSNCLVQAILERAANALPMSRGRKTS